MRAALATLGAAAVVAAVAGTTACAHGNASTEAAMRAQAEAALRAAAGGWRILSLDDFRGYDSADVPKGWALVGQTIMKSHAIGDLVTKDQFANFELQFEWMVGHGGKSGVFYRGTREYDRLDRSAPEYALLDNHTTPEGKTPIRSAGSAYDLYAPLHDVAKKHDQWNSSLLVVNGTHVEHWLNGEKILEYEIGSLDWKSRVAASPFAPYPGFGTATRGYIGIEGGGAGTLQLRDIRIRELR